MVEAVDHRPEGVVMCAMLLAIWLEIVLEVAEVVVITVVIPESSS